MAEPIAAALPDAAAVPCRRRTAEVLEFRARGEYATFTIDAKSDVHYYALSIDSSFGGYSYAWSAPGDNFNAFLCRLDCSYVLGKMVGHDEVFDGEGTTNAVRKAIIELRKDGECDRDDARAEWPKRDFERQGDFERWCEHTVLFRGREPWFFHQTCGGDRTREFTALYELFWPLLRAALTEVESG
jgi:hypothetical protein